MPCTVVAKDIRVLRYSSFFFCIWINRSILHVSAFVKLSLCHWVGNGIGFLFLLFLFVLQPYLGFIRSLTAQIDSVYLHLSSSYLWDSLKSRISKLKQFLWSFGLVSVYCNEIYVFRNLLVGVYSHATGFKIKHVFIPSPAGIDIQSGWCKVGFVSS